MSSLLSRMKLMLLFDRRIASISKCSGTRQSSHSSRRGTRQRSFFANPRRLTASMMITQEVWRLPLRSGGKSGDFHYVQAGSLATSTTFRQEVW
ncbi:MAG: hypothetical protein U0996_14025 [Planctomycetaceae bacterium]